MNTLVCHKSIDYSPQPRRRGIWDRLFSIMSLARQRRALHDLDDHLLQDIGITRHDAQFEAHRRLWDVPLNHKK